MGNPNHPDKRRTTVLEAGRVGPAIISILLRIEYAMKFKQDEAAYLRPDIEVCGRCGCLCLPVEMCPGCAAAQLENVVGEVA